MKAVLQVVSRASVEVEGSVVGKIEGPGLVVLLGVTHGDTPALAAKLAAKVWRLRMLAGEKSCEDLAAPLLVVSQFTLYGDVRKGRRPGWTACRSGRGERATVRGVHGAASRARGTRRVRRVWGDDGGVAGEFGAVHAHRRHRRAARAKPPPLADSMVSPSAVGRDQSPGIGHAVSSGFRGVSHQCSWDASDQGIHVARHNHIAPLDDQPRA